jgi:hypothetical protein
LGGPASIACWARGKTVSRRRLDRTPAGQSIAVMCRRVTVSLVWSIDRLNALAELYAADMAPQPGLDGNSAWSLWLLNR